MFVLARRHLTATLILFGFMLAIAAIAWLVLLAGLSRTGLLPRTASFGLRLARELTAALGWNTAIWACLGMLACGLLLIVTGLLRALDTAIERWV